MQITVFTSVLGRRTDRLRIPTIVNSAVRYLCFSDQPLRVRPYEWIPTPCPISHNGDRRVELRSRELKILANAPELGSPDVLLWHDAAFRMDCDPVAVVNRHLGSYDVLAFSHPHRSRIEDEAVAIAKIGYLPMDRLTRQIETYRTEGFVTQTAITSTGFCLRRNTPAVQDFNRTWWAEVDRWGWRDQMSVDYAVWKTGVKVGYIPGHYRDNPFAKWFKG